MQNKGNIIARITPKIAIMKQDKKISSIGSKAGILIMPYSDYNISIAFDSTNLSSGDYTAVAKIAYNSRETDEKTLSFHVDKAKSTTVSKEHTSDKTIKIRKGAVLPLNLTLNKPNTGISFYRITYSIPETALKGVVEGEIRGKAKNVRFKVNTSKLGYGTYILKMEIRKGRNLEDYDYKNITLKVVPGFHYLWLAIISLMFFIFMFLLYKHLSFNKSTLSSTISFAFGAFLKNAFNFIFDLFTSHHKSKSIKARISHLSEDISRLEAAFDRKKADIDALSKDIAGFVKSSNEWLYSRYRSGKYAFK